MEALKRSVMLLRPGDGRLIEPGRGGGSLKLLSKGRGVDISLKADCLKEGDFFLYLFTKDGKELYNIPSDDTAHYVNKVMNAINTYNNLYK